MPIYELALDFMQFTTRLNGVWLGFKMIQFLFENHQIKWQQAASK